MTTTTGHPDQTDLQEYSRTGNRDALGRLARRHINFVYGVARREVGDAHLAEDIVQAVFMILARSAGKVRAASLSGWLFATTRHVASNALKTAARRQFHEKRAAALKAEHVMIPDPAELEHIQHHLHAALSAQSESDRSIVLMRYMDGLEVNQIGDQLGVSHVAARKRLERALNRVRTFMKKRGVVAGSAALGVALANVAEAAPAGLVAGVVTSSVSATASAAALAKVTHTALLWSQIKTAAVVFLTIGVSATVATGIGVVVARRTAAGPAGTTALSALVVPATTPATQPATNTVRYVGKVTDPQGKPVAGVRVWSELWAGDPANVKPVELETTTDAAGQYVLGPLPFIENPKIRSSSAWRQRGIRFDQAGYAIAWKDTRPDTEMGEDLNAIERSVELEPAGQIRIKTIDAAGKPVAGADVSIDLQHGMLRQRGGGYGYLKLPMKPEVARTDKEGIAVFDRIPQNARAHAMVTHPDFANLSTRDDYRGDWHPIRASGVPVVMTLQPGGKIRVRLPQERMKLTRAAAITANPETKSSSARTFVWAQGIFDAEGSYVMSGLKPGTYTLTMGEEGEHAEDGVWIPVKGIRVEAGQTVDISPQFATGQIITGRVIDAQSKSPLAQQYVSARSEDATLRSSRSAAPTGVDGRFSVRVLPGAYVLEFPSYTKTEYLPIRKSVTVTDGAAVDIGDAEVSSPQSVRGRLVDSKGQPVVGVVMLSFDKRPTTPDGSFAIPMCAGGGPRESVELYAFSEDRSLARAIVVNDSFTDPKLAGAAAKDLPAIELQASAMVVGELIDEAGAAVTDAQVQLGIEQPGDGGMSIGYPRPPWGGFTQEGNKFVYRVLPLGMKMSVTAYRDNLYVNESLADLAPGEARELGKLVLTPRIERSRPDQPPEQKPAERDFTGELTGIVLDENGKPKMGVSIQVAPDRGGMFSSSSDTSDQEGRFLFSKMPKGEQVRIFANADGYKRQDALATTGQRDISIRIERLGSKLIGKPAPGLQVGHWVNGEPKTLAALKGKVILLHIGGTTQWGYSSYRNVVDAATMFEKRGLVVIAVHQSVNQPTKQRAARETTVEDIAPYVKEHKIPFAFAIDDGSKTQESYGVEHNDPAIVLIDKTGVVRAVLRYANLQPEIEKLLAE